ncbi:uncharacterized protein METZ01_LOCUS484613 [marine metagenome]|uniref:Uncharacterized protein n=1 Tax=marine metagenome TaxID=408172 RepID=A0A383CI61_9ZZZZ
MSGAQRTSIMQVKPTSVSARLPNGEVKLYEGNTVIMADFGMWIKGDDSLELFPWERVLHVFFDNIEEQTKVWEEVVLTVFDDIFEDYDDEEDEEVVDESTTDSNQVTPDTTEVLGVTPDTTENPTDVIETPTPNPSGDNPDVNPYE